MQPPTWTDALAAGCPVDGLYLLVDATAQQLTLFDRGAFVAQYPVSTAKAGLGCEEGSLKTPVGWHQVADRIGAGAALGQVFRSRVPTGEIVAPGTSATAERTDLILTRILRLRGLEKGRNAGSGIDTYDRFIYIHGTQEEALLGAPVSHGCIRMANRDVVELFDALSDRPAWCWIGGTPAAKGEDRDGF